jgi:hypothetical protein
MKLYELKRGDWFVLTEEAQAPPDIGGYPALKCFRLETIDGMYSRCYDTFGKLCHPVAWAEVEKTEPQ